MESSIIPLTRDSFTLMTGFILVQTRPDGLLKGQIPFLNYFQAEKCFYIARVTNYLKNWAAWIMIVSPLEVIIGAEQKLVQTVARPFNNIASSRQIHITATTPDWLQQHRLQTQNQQRQTLILFHTLMMTWRKNKMSIYDER